ncbi:hypothetical protein [Pseudomonas sp.]|nr:hypothetical protein [Pseudomonas sp.]MDP2242861.1 hypothetical protein [Pseudomonas sp.]
MLAILAPQSTAGAASRGKNQAQKGDGFIFGVLSAGGAAEFVPFHSNR